MYPRITAVTTIHRHRRIYRGGGSASVMSYAAHSLTHPYTYTVRGGAGRSAVGAQGPMHFSHHSTNAHFIACATRPCLRPIISYHSFFFQAEARTVFQTQRSSSGNPLHALRNPRRARRRIPDWSTEGFTTSSPSGAGGASAVCRELCAHEGPRRCPGAECAGHSAFSCLRAVVLSAAAGGEVIT